jgi:hypothetical protein
MDGSVQRFGRFGHVAAIPVGLVVLAKRSRQFAVVSGQSASFFAELRENSVITDKIARSREECSAICRDPGTGSVGSRICNGTAGRYFGKKAAMKNVTELEGTVLRVLPKNGPFIAI